VQVLHHLPVVIEGMGDGEGRRRVPHGTLAKKTVSIRYRDAPFRIDRPTLPVRGFSLKLFESSGFRQRGLSGTEVAGDSRRPRTTDKMKGSAI